MPALEISQVGQRSDLQGMRQYAQAAPGAAEGPAAQIARHARKLPRPTAQQLSVRRPWCTCMHWHCLPNQLAGVSGATVAHALPRASSQAMACLGGQVLVLANQLNGQAQACEGGGQAALRLQHSKSVQFQLLQARQRLQWHVEARVINVHNLQLAWVASHAQSAGAVSSGHVHALPAVSSGRFAIQPCV